MLRDFLLGGEFSHPMAFAKSFYLHYPKVAIGQWPPFLYAVLGSWMVVFGASRTAALTLIAITAVATTTLIYLVGRPRVGRPPALLAGLVFLTSPLVQQSTDQVMTEHLVTLLALSSALLFARYARTVRLADALLFGILAALAILTRGSAWALALVPGHRHPSGLAADLAGCVELRCSGTSGDRGSGPKGRGPRESEECRINRFKTASYGRCVDYARRFSV